MADIFATAWGAGGDVFAPALFTGITGDGQIVAGVPIVSGGGSAAVNVVGTAGIVAGVPTLSGSGLVFTVITGSGALTTNAASISAYGAVSAGYFGVATLFTETIAVSGAGEVVSPSLPEITDNGNLTTSIPYYGQAVALDYADVAAWVAGFTSTVPVTNDAPFVIERSAQPVPVTFTAANQFGSVSVTRYLTINQEPNTGTLVPNQADLRLNYPLFNDPVTYSYQQLDVGISTAQTHISTSNYGRLNGASRLRAIYLMAAHMLTIQQQAKTGGTASLVSGATVDKVSVQLTPPPLKTQWQWWLSTTPYGAELMGLLAVKSTGGFYIPGSLSRAGFRKANGSF